MAPDFQGNFLSEKPSPSLRDRFGPGRASRKPKRAKARPALQAEYFSPGPSETTPGCEVHPPDHAPAASPIPIPGGPACVNFPLDSRRREDSLFIGRPRVGRPPRFEAIITAYNSLKNLCCKKKETKTNS